jgi:Mrp family chromosome partitioning ATPase/uncharacterized protein involved in exopolysaccharide biosynthesis
MILILSVLGVVGYFVAPFVIPVPYQSEAKLMIRYVAAPKTPDQTTQSGVNPDPRGEGVMPAEVDILTSRDTAEQVVNIFGAEKILAKLGGGNDKAKAIAIVHAGIVADAGRRGNVMRVLFEHPDPEVVQPVLRQIVESYLKRHAAIRTGGALDQFLTQETDQLRSQFLQTDEELRKIKAKAGVMSLDEAKKAYSEQIANFRQQIYAAEAELAERQAAVTEMSRMLNIPLGTNISLASSITASNTASSSNQVATTAPPQATEVPPTKVADYRRIAALVDTYLKREQELLLQFSEESSRVKTIREQLAEAQKQKLQLETDHPGLLSVQVATSKTSESGDPQAKAREALMQESARVLAAISKIKILTEQLDKVRKEASGVLDAEGTIAELQMRRDQQESKYKAFYASLEQARISERFDNGKVSNISPIQDPTPPFRDQSKLKKVRLGLLVGGFAFALGLAFILEMYLDPRIKRPEDIQVKVGLPLFMSIPVLEINGKSKALKGSHVPLLAAGDKKTNGDNGPDGSTAGTTMAVAPASLDLPAWSAEHKIRPYSEALRDRLINYFDANNMTHKPKLVAVTSCGEGAGVSSVAAGLAASLSETGDGNVLLVDMNEANGSAKQFFRGDLAYGIDEALEMDKRDDAMVQEKLYVVSETTSGRDQLPSMLPKRFKNLVPKLKASDYDYIIFDMPPVTQVSLTPRLARFMDMTLIVAEAEKTSKDVVKQAGALLGESKCHVGVVLNKSKSYIPKKLVQEL